MKDFLPTFTFGFLMAQLFPGAVTVLSYTSLYLSRVLETAPPSMPQLFDSIGDIWFTSIRNLVVFSFLSAATGMFIHGIDWMVLATLENEGETVRPIRLFPWHRRPIWFQVLLSPFNMIHEITKLLRAPRLEKILVDENVPHISGESMPVFNFLQDFYLYFAQFYVHMAYALFFSIPALIVTYINFGSTFVTLPRLVYLFIVYLLTSTFFIMGRAQLNTLFRAEETLKRRTKAKEEAEPSQRIKVSYRN